MSAAHDPRTTLRSAIFEANGNAHRATEVDPRVCDCCQTAAASVDDGVVIAYRDRSAGENRDIAVASGRAGNWQRGGLVARDGWTITGCPVNGPATAAHDGATAVAWFTDADGARRVRVARRMSGDPAWSAPVDVSRDTLGRVDVTWLGDAALAVSWLAETTAGQAAILVARVDSAGQVGSPVAVATTRAARPAGFPRLVAHHDELLVAWTRWQDEQPRVVVSHLANRALTAGF